MAVNVQDVLTTVIKLQGSENYATRMGQMASATEMAAARQRDLAGKLNALSLGLGAFGASAAATSGYTLKMAASMEMAQVSFSTLLKSSDKSKTFIKELQDFAASTPFEFMGLQDNAKKMLAFGFSAQQTIPMLRTLGDAVGSLGGGSEMIDRVTRAMGQMKAKGKPQAEELLQLAEAGIPVYAILQKQLNLTGTEVANIGRSGISSGKVIDALLKGMNELYGGGMAKQAETFNGILSNIHDNLQLFGSELGETVLPAAKWVANHVQGMTQSLREMDPALKTALGYMLEFGGVALPIAAVYLKLKAFSLQWKANTSLIKLAKQETMAAHTAEGASVERLTAEYARLGATKEAAAVAGIAPSAIPIGSVPLERAIVPAGNNMVPFRARTVGHIPRVVSATEMSSTTAAGATKVGFGARAAGALSGAGALLMNPWTAVIGTAVVGGAALIAGAREKYAAEGRALAEATASGWRENPAPVQAMRDKIEDMAVAARDNEGKFKEEGQNAGDAYAAGFRERAYGVGVTQSETEAQKAAKQAREAKSQVERERALAAEASAQEDKWAREAKKQEARARGLHGAPPGASKEQRQEQYRQWRAAIDARREAMRMGAMAANDRLKHEQRVADMEKYEAEHPGSAAFKPRIAPSTTSQIAAPGSPAPSKLRTGHAAGKGRPGVETYRPDIDAGQRGYMTGMLGVNARGTTVRPVDVNANGRRETVIYVDVDSKLVDTDGRTRAETTRANRRAAQAAFAQ